MRFIFGIFVMFLVAGFMRPLVEPVWAVAAALAAGWFASRGGK
jgi:uncharacterized membrane protein required for colicin V production